MKIINKLKDNIYLIIIVLLCFIPLIWFWGRGDILITGLDTNFPLDPLVWFKRRLFVWNGINNAGSDFSSSVAGVFFHFVQLIPYLFNFSLKSVEIISLVFWFSAIVLSSFLMARTILPENKISQLIIVVLYTLNIYLFNTWENVKVANLSLVATLPLFTAVVYLWISNKIENKKAILYLCLASILASGSGINPAYFSVIILVLFIEIITLFFLKLSVKNEKTKIIKKGLISFIILFTINIFWIFPLFNFLYSINTTNLTDIGLTNWLKSLSENTSVMNVIRLQGAWDWYALDSYGMPQYLPYTLNYLYKLPFIVFSFIVPLFSLISFLFIERSKRIWYIYFGILALLGIFLGVGSHPPTGSFFLFIVEHVPFLSFFRSPWYIFTPILTLSYAGLVGLLVESLSYKLKNRKFLFNILISIFLIFYCLYSYPLITGKIFRPGRRDGFYINFPKYVWDTRDWLKNTYTLDNGRIISYPDDQLESFKWGYQGTESILSLYSEREVVTPSFNVASKPFLKMLDCFYGYMKRGEYNSAITVMNFFGADEIFYKKDSPTLSSEIENKINNLVDTYTLGEWLFMQPKIKTNKKIFMGSYVYKNLSNPEDFVSLIPLIKTKSIVVNSNDTEITKIKSNDSFPIILKTDILDKDENKLSNIKKYEFTLLKDGMFFIVIKRDYIDENSLSLKIDLEEINNSLIEYNESLINIGPIKLNSGKHLIEVIYPEVKNLITVTNFEQVSNVTKLRNEELPIDVNKTLISYNDDKVSQKITLSVKDFNPYLRYAIGYDYKYIYGKIPFVEALQSTSTSPVKTYPVYPGSSTDWESRYDIFYPVETNSKLELSINVGSSQVRDKSKMFFENIFVKRIYDNEVFVVENKTDNIQDSLLQPEIVYKKISPVKYEITLMENHKLKNDAILVFLDNYNKGWVLKKLGNETKINFKHFTVNGYANGWHLPTGTEGGKYIIYYRPQSFYVMGVFISVCSTAFIIVWNVIKKQKND